METLPPGIRDRYSALCQALREEYSQYTDQASAILGAFAIMQKRLEPPKEYYRRLRAAYFQGRNAPGLEEDHAFKSLFLHNLHESVRYDVTMHCRTANLAMQEIRRYAQLAWETRVRPGRATDNSARVLEIRTPGHADLALEGNEKPRAKMHAKTSAQARQTFRQPGGRQSQRTEGPNQFQQKPRQPRPFQSNKKVFFDQKSKQHTRYDGKAPTPSQEEELISGNMADFIRKCVAEMVRQMDVSNRPSAQPDTPGKSMPSHHRYNLDRFYHHPMSKFTL